MKKNDMDEMILMGASIDDLIKMKIEKDFMEDLEKSKQKVEKKIYTEIKDVPQDKIFSKDAVYKVYNKNTRCETFINGIQAEALIGIQNNIREKMLKGELSVFTTDEAYVKFEKVIADAKVC